MGRRRRVVVPEKRYRELAPASRVCRTVRAATGIPERKALVLYATQRPLTFSSGNQPSGVPAWRTIPSWYLIGTQDKIIPPAQQRFMAERAHARIEEVKAGHLAMVSRPDAVTDLILSAVRATG